MRALTGALATRMRRPACRGLVALALAMPLPVHAQGMTGGFLYDLCHDRTTAVWQRSGQWVCGAYLRGLVDGVRQQAFRETGSYEGHLRVMPFCTPPGADTDATLGVVLRHVETHPETREQSAGLTIVQALSAAWPCARELK